MLDSTLATHEGDLRGLDIPEISALDLSGHVVLAHFANSTRHAQLLNFLLGMDRLDKWTVDYNETQAPNPFEIKGFLQDLEAFVTDSLPVLHRVPKEFADLLSHLTTTRCIHLIRFVAQHNEDFLEAFGFMLQDESGRSVEAAAVRRRLIAFSKARLLSQIFSGARLEQIARIMSGYADV